MLGTKLQKDKRSRESSESAGSWQTFPLIVFVPSLLILSFCIVIQFFPERTGSKFNIFSAIMTGKKEGRLSPGDPNSYSRPGKPIITR
jgi:H+/Cl- antiporter ClcA